jgi:D-glycero-D-manno-heptose 1,7-bisphosphate phosphatase
MKTAVFLDRDGTIIEDGGYIASPEEVRLLPGAVEGMRKLADAGYLLVLVSNQSGLARGLFDEEALNSVHARLEGLLSEGGARLDGSYYCPYLAGPEAVVEAYRCESDLRKPKPGMLLQASKEMDIDSPRSWMIGNSLADVLAGQAAGCGTILLCESFEISEADVRPTFYARDLSRAADLILSQTEVEMADNSSSRETHGQQRAASDASVELLTKIHDQLDRANRQKRQRDFSVVRLVAALLQMFAVVTAVWGFMSLVGNTYDAATPRLVLACFFQLAAVSAFVIDYLS